MAELELIKEQPARITCDTKTSLTTGTLPKIIYEKPVSKTTGEWVGVISGNTIYFDSVLKELDEAGWWYVHPQVNLAGLANPHYGKRASFLVKDKFKA